MTTIIVKIQNYGLYCQHNALVCNPEVTKMVIQAFVLNDTFCEKAYPCAAILCLIQQFAKKDVKISHSVKLP